MTESWKSSVKAIILDMDGVVWRGKEPIGDLQSIFKRINEIGWKYTFATNNATLSVQKYIDVLSSFGVDTEPWQVITSAAAVTSILLDLFPSGGPIYIIGEQGLIDACSEAGFVNDERKAQAVVVGFDRTLTFEKLKIGTLLLRGGVPFIATNPDPTFPTPQGLIPGAGSIVAALSTASGRTPIIAGKPEPTMYRIALERLNTTANHVMVIGDRPETDIAGAQALGCYTALVLTGVTSAEQAQRWSPAPDLIADSLTDLVSMNW